MSGMRCAVIAGIVISFIAGCPSAPSGRAGSVDGPNGENPDPVANDNSDPTDGETGLIVETVAGSEPINVDIYVASTNVRVAQARSTDELIELDPGEYKVTEYSNEGFVVAPLVSVSAGEVARVGLGAVHVTTTAGSQAAIYDIYDATGETLLDRVTDTDEVRPLPAGAYVLKEYFNDAFDFARDLVVTEGAVTTVALGALLVTTTSGSEAAIYDIYDATGETLLDRVNDTDEVRPLPAGTYVLKEYFNDVFEFARDVVVSEDLVTTVSLGAVRMITVEGAEAVTYDIFDATGETRLDQVNDTDLIRPMPPGTYVLKEYFNEPLVFAAGVVVEADAVTDVVLGAIQFNGGTELYDIYDAGGETVLAQANDAGEIRTLPAGTFVLKPYFEDSVLADDVAVAPGAVTTVP